jgi:hypothetical protein
LAGQPSFEGHQLLLLPVQCGAELVETRTSQVQAALFVCQRFLPHLELFGLRREGCLALFEFFRLAVQRRVLLLNRALAGRELRFAAA